MNGCTYAYCASSVGSLTAWIPLQNVKLRKLFVRRECKVLSKRSEGKDLTTMAFYVYLKGNETVSLIFAFLYCLFVANIDD